MGRIDIAHVSKSYDGVPAISDLNMTIGDGEFVTLLGPSGCGKTTTLNLLAGFLQPDEGTIAVDGRMVSSATSVIEPERREMGLVFQSYALWPHKSVHDNVAYGLQRRKVGRTETADRVSRMLELVGLSGLERRYPGQLSGGQQQRVALARSLVTEPSMLLLDEPLSNLDAKLRDTMRDELLKIQRRLGITFVYVTHDQVEAMSMSDRIAVLDGGELVQYAQPKEVYLRPATPFVADFMGLINFLDGTVVADPDGGSVRVRLDADGAPEVDARGTALAPSTGADSRVRVAIRPETISIIDQATTADGDLRGTIDHLTLLGNITHCFVDVGSTLVRVQAGHDLDASPGDQIGLRVHPGYAVAFDADTDPTAPPAAALVSAEAGPADDA